MLLYDMTDPWGNPLFLFDGEGGGADDGAGGEGNGDGGGADDGAGGDDKTIPYSRFKEVNDRMKKAEAELKKQADDRKKADEKALKDQEKWKELAEKREKELEAERLSNLRTEVALEVGLPISMAKRLVGATREELEEDAKVILEAVDVKDDGDGRRTHRSKNKGGETKPFSLAGKTPAEIREARAAGKISMVQTGG